VAQTPGPGKYREKGERHLEQLVFRDWAALNTTNSRNAIPQQTFAHLVNLQPVGYSNLHTIPNKSAVLHDYGSDTIYYDQQVNIGGTLYLLQASTTGKLFAFNLSTNTYVGQINGSITLSGTGTRLTQWQTSVALGIDSSGGYFSWNGSGNITALTGTGFPTTGTDIAVWQGRVWVLNGRLLQYSVAGGATTGYGNASTDWTNADGSGYYFFIDPIILGAITRMVALNGYLYFFSPTAIAGISDLYIPSGSTQPAFTELPLQSIIGTDQPYSIVAFNRSILFATRYGIYELDGVNVTKLSGPDDTVAVDSTLDGTWQYLDPSLPISAGLATVGNIFCGAFLFKQLNDPVWGSQTYLAMMQRNRSGLVKWWFAQYSDSAGNTLKRVTQGVQSNVPTLYGYINNKLYQLFSDTTTAPPSTLSTPLWDMGDPISDKQFITVGFNLSQLTVGGGMFTMTVDTTTGSTAVANISSITGAVDWVNNAGATVSWENNSLAIVTWVGSAYLTYQAQSPGGFDKYVGLTLSNTGSIYQLNSILVDWKFGARWDS
jgi:hypothetical protein